MNEEKESATHCSGGRRILAKEEWKLGTSRSPEWLEPVSEGNSDE